MAPKWIELVTGSLEQKKEYKQYRARIDALPEPYVTVAKALNRYFMYNGGVMDAEVGLKMMGDFTELWERAAADGTPVRDIVGEDPAEFADTFTEAYTGKRWIDKERARLAETVERAEQGPGGRVMTMRLTADPAIRVQGLEKSYKKLHVLRGVDFDVAHGSIFALLGSNGAGKTTVVKILSTLLKADAGSVGVNGFDVAAQAGNVRESISLTGQFAAVDEVLSGREPHLGRQAAAPREPQGDRGRIARAVLADRRGGPKGVDVLGRHAPPPRHLHEPHRQSAGDLLRQPTTGLDPEGRLEVWEAVKGLAGRGTTVLLTTQYLDEAEQLADRIAILHEGRIVANGTLAELKQLLPPAKVEYVEKQPTLEEVFLAIVGNDGKDATPAMTAAPAATSKEQR